MYDIMIFYQDVSIHLYIFIYHKNIIILTLKEPYKTVLSKKKSYDFHNE